MTHPSLSTEVSQTTSLPTKLPTKLPSGQGHASHRIATTLILLAICTVLAFLPWAHPWTLRRGTDARGSRWVIPIVLPVAGTGSITRGEISSEFVRWIRFGTPGSLWQDSVRLTTAANLIHAPQRSVPVRWRLQQSGLATGEALRGPERQQWGRLTAVLHLASSQWMEIQHKQGSFRYEKEVPILRRAWQWTVSLIPGEVGQALGPERFAP